MLYNNYNRYYILYRCLLNGRSFNISRLTFLEQLFQLCQGNIILE